MSAVEAIAKRHAKQIKSGTVAPHDAWGNTISLTPAWSTSGSLLIHIVLFLGGIYVAVLAASRAIAGATLLSSLSGQDQEHALKRTNSITNHY